MTGQWNYKGIIPALSLPLKADLSIDEHDLRRLSQWLTTFKGISALMTNGHTGEVFSPEPVAAAVKGLCSEVPARCGGSDQTFARDCVRAPRSTNICLHRLVLQARAGRIGSSPR